MTTVLPVDPQNPGPGQIAIAAELIAKGAVVAMPFETVYGLAVDATNHQAVQRVLELKRRTDPPPLIIGRWSDLTELAEPLSPAAQRLIEKFWPGPLTLIMMAKSELIAPACRPEGKVGLKLSDLALPTKLARRVGAPLTATSANLTGRPSALSASDVERYFPKNLGLILDGGPAASMTPSTVVDVTGPKPLILRPGVISRADIMATWGVRGVRGVRRRPGATDA